MRVTTPANIMSLSHMDPQDLQDPESTRHMGRGRDTGNLCQRNALTGWGLEVHLKEQKQNLKNSLFPALCFQLNNKPSLASISLSTLVLWFY